MAINFSGEFTTPGSPEEVFDFLSDPNKFGPLLPDFQSMSMTDPTHFAVKVRVGVGNIRGSAEIKMELSEALKPVRALYKGQGTAVGSQVTVSAGFDLSPLSGDTKVAWRGEANIFGKLASMAGGMLEPLGKKNIQKLIDGLQKALSERATQPAPEPLTPQAEAPADLAPLGDAASTPAGHTSPEAGAPPAVEAPGFSPANPDPQQKETSVTTTIEGAHGDHNPQPNH